MTAENEPRIYMCPRHLVPQLGPGKCPQDCALELIECLPGDPDDPCRRPLVDENGSIKTRAPLWWLRHSVSELWPFIKPK